MDDIILLFTFQEQWSPAKIPEVFSPEAPRRLTPRGGTGDSTTTANRQFPYIPTPLLFMPYRPQPLDTSHVAIPEGLQGLLEKLAANVHELWADQRLKDGWKAGPVRDDAKKEHPCLKPFDELPESEQEYDRRIVRDTLRAILAMGYRIEK
jgi:hypothetical protein